MYHSSWLPVAETLLRLCNEEPSEHRGLGIAARQVAAAVSSRTPLSELLVDETAFWWLRILAKVVTH